MNKRQKENTLNSKLIARGGGIRSPWRTMRVLFAVAAAVVLAVGCGKNDGAGNDLKSEDDIAGRTVTYNTGSIYDLMYSSRTDIEKVCFNTQPDCAQALVDGKADVMIDDDCVFSPELMKQLGIRLALRGSQEFPCGFIFNKKDTTLCRQMSTFIDTLQATGELKAIYERWFLCDTPSLMKMPDMGPEPKGEPIKANLACNLAPISFAVGEKWQGLEPELLEMFARYVGRPVEIDFIQPASLVMSVQTGQSHIGGGGLFITEERKQSINFASSHFSSHPGFYVRAEGGKRNGNLWTSIKQSINNNLIVEGRWRYITEGLWETVKISVFALLLGTLLGGLLCWASIKGRKWLRKFTEWYIDFMRGIPLLVLLMILFYVVLAKTGLGGTTVAVIAFAINFAAYVSEMFRTAILSVGNGQREAGLAIGFTPLQTFLYITAPQALKNVLPVYKGEAVSLVKNTSIVGYIAIHDLTRASDMIRSRTFDAFFPLLVVTIIYFILAWLLGRLLDLTVKNKKK